MASKKSTPKNTQTFASDEQIFHLMFEGHSAIMLLIEPATGLILDANQAAVNFYGYPKSKLCSMSIYKINTLPPAQVETERQRALNREQNYFIFPHRLASGEERIVEVHSSPVVWQKKQVFFSIVHDITERKQMEEALQKSDAMFQALFEFAPDAIVVTNHAGNIMQANAQAEVIFGYRRNELNGQLIEKLLPERFANQHMKHRMVYAVDSHTRNMGAGLDIYGRRKDGSEFPIDISLGVLETSSGKLILSIIRDITERKRAEEELHESEERIRIIFQTLSEGVTLNEMVFNDNNEMVDHRVLEVNDAFYKIADFRKEGSVIGNVATKLYGMDVETIKSFWENHKKAIETQRIEFISPISKRIFSISTSPFKDNRFVTSFQDITERKQAEEELRESESRFRTLFNQMAVGVARIQTQTGRFIQINQKYCDIIGYSFKEMEALDFQSITHPDDLQPDLENMERLKSDSIREFTMEKRLIHKNGSIVWVTLTVSPMWASGAAPDFHIAIVQDITVRKQVEEELKESEGRYRTLIEWLPEAIAVYQDGLMVYFNPAAIKLLGAESTQELMGKSGFDLVHPDFHQMALARIKNSIDNGVSAPLAEMQFLKVDGTTLDAESHAMPIVYDGKPSMIIVFRDITERKQTEERLLLQSAALETAANAIAITDKNGLLQWVNSAWVALTGYSKEEALGQNPRIVKSGKHDAGFYKRMWDTIIAGKVWHGEVVNKRKDGTLYFEEETITPVLDQQGNVKNFIAIKQDITARKQTENELQIQKDELELKNKQLAKSKMELQAAVHQYSDLYDFAPIGYFTLNRDGIILQTNLAGANLLGMEYEKLIKQNIGSFVSTDSRTAFDVFFKNLLTSYEKDICELELIKDGNKPIWVSIDASTFEGGSTSRAVIIDITERRQADANLQSANEKLEAANIKLQAAFEHAQYLAHTDALTGINNRRHLYELAEHEFDVARRYQQPLSVIMFDLDHFKLINDNFGHATGDQMLESVIKVARSQLRDVDLIGRYGGEEFVIVLPVTSAEHAYLLAERIRISVAALRVETASVTLSIGIAEMIHTAQDEEVENVIRRADEAMYTAKEAGRNRIVIFGQK